MLCVAQRPYLAVGTLREQLTYPDKPDSPAVAALAARHSAARSLDETLAGLLELVGLAPLLGREYSGGKDCCCCVLSEAVVRAASVACRCSHRELVARQVSPAGRQLPVGRRYFPSVSSSGSGWR